jgi:two-component system cell cycle sensor histidine kinase/response regulator CckA
MSFMMVVLEDHLRILATTSRTFTEVMGDPRLLCAAISRTFVTRLGDAALVLLPENEPDLLDQPLFRRVFDTGEPFVLPTIDRDALVAQLTARELELFRSLGNTAHSLMILPLGPHAEELGIIVLSRAQAGGTPYGAADLALAKGLADLAGMALMGCRLVAAERTSEEGHRLLFEASPLPMYVFDAETLEYLAVNDSAINLYGYTREELLGLRILDLRVQEDFTAMREQLRKRGPGQTTGTAGHRRKDGSVIRVEFTSRAINFAGRKARMAVVRDVTHQRALEEQLRQSQKMEAIGRLAGGVAHDFNNMLTVIINYTDLMLADLEPRDRKREIMEEIAKASARAADLTRQLLTFSRQQVVAPAVLNLNEVLASVDKMLRRIVGEDIQLLAVREPTLGPVLADRGSIEQLVMNLVVNARDAMPTGGKLTIETRNVDLDGEHVRKNPGAAAGAHVVLSVTDTGVGIDAATQARIFEPFFTTKDQGRGTGLGLSTVFGVVQQSGGHIEVESAPGQGTRFIVNFPRAAAASPEPRTAAITDSMRGSERILLVEDQDQVRAVLSGMLRNHGYEVIEARDANDALTLSNDHPDRIDLLLTDVVMPLMSGTALAKLLAPTRPEMRVIFMSGYTDDAALRHGAMEPGTRFIQKPISGKALARAVRDALDTPESLHGPRS